MPCLTNFLSYMYLHNMLGRNNYILVLNMSYFAKKRTSRMLRVLLYIIIS
jgi:hypothetical protein